MTHTDTTPASPLVRDLPATTLDLADLWLMAQDEDPTYDPDLPFGHMMDTMP